MRLNYDVSAVCALNVICYITSDSSPIIIQNPMQQVGFLSQMQLLSAGLSPALIPPSAADRLLSELE